MAATVEHLGAFGLLATVATSCATNVAMRISAGQVGADLTVFLVYFVGFVILLPLVIRTRSDRLALRLLAGNRRLGGHLARATTAYVSKLAWLYALVSLPLGLATALYLTRAFFLLLWSACIHRDGVGPLQWLAIAVGLSGAVVALQPIGHGSAFGAAMALLSAGASAASAVQLKGLAAADTPLLTTFVLTALMIPVAAPPAMANWQWPEPSLWAYLGLASLLSVGTQALLVYAYARVKLMRIAALDLLYLVGSFVTGALVFAEKIDAPAVIGSGLILASSFGSLCLQTGGLRRIGRETS